MRGSRLIKNLLQSQPLAVQMQQVSQFHSKKTRTLLGGRLCNFFARFGRIDELFLPFDDVA